VRFKMARCGRVTPTPGRPLALSPALCVAGALEVGALLLHSGRRLDLAARFEALRGPCLIEGQIKNQIGPARG
jgi:hypothetical protein